MTKLRITAIIIAIIGLAISTYLAITKLAQKDVFCIGGANGCNIVNSSSYSMWRGIPVAILGVIGYTVILVLLFLQKRQKFESSVIILAFFGVTAFGIAYSIYLTYVELFIIHAVCSWCMLSAISMLALFIISSVTLGRSKLMKNSH